MKVLFCSTCGNMLTIARIKKSDSEELPPNAFQCRTCPYQRVLNKPWRNRTYLKKKEVEDIIGEKDQWESAQKVQVQCSKENCDSRWAFYYQVQIRSADEPMTTFYKCTECGTQWREG